MWRVSLPDGGTMEVHNDDVHTEPNEYEKQHILKQYFIEEAWFNEWFTDND